MVYVCYRNLKLRVNINVKNSQEFLLEIVTMIFDISKRKSLYAYCFLCWISIHRSLADTLSLTIKINILE